MKGELLQLEGEEVHGGPLQWGAREEQCRETGVPVPGEPAKPLVGGLARMAPMPPGAEAPGVPQQMPAEPTQSRGSQLWLQGHVRLPRGRPSEQWLPPLEAWAATRMDTAGHWSGPIPVLTRRGRSRFSWMAPQPQSGDKGIW